MVERQLASPQQRVAVHTDVSTVRSMASQPIELQTIRILAGERQSRIFQPGEVIFRSGEVGDYLYGVVRGEVRIDWDNQLMHEIITAGSSFGIGALVDPEHRRYGTARAVVETEIIALDREQFLLAVQELPMFGLEMLHDLDQRLRDLKSQISATSSTEG
jgi:CRP/FNR family cyclic AMP-dependent transcriptional regulator